MNSYFNIVFLGIFVKLCFSWNEPPFRLKIGQGIIEGITLKSDGIRIFYGIPYAASPVGALRFSPPIMHSGWNGTYQALNRKPRCPQLPLRDNDNEDCLYLDIWMPEVNSSFQRPVVVFFGGVDFIRDSQLNFSGQELAIRGIVVVRVTYRLNIFGFFSLGTPEFRGNVGLLDQYYALLWVRENIVHFGGDNRNVTLFGHHSGAASIGLHMTSPRTQGLFQKALLSSGSAVAPWIVENDTIGVSKQITRILKCEDNPVDCLRSKTVAELLQAFQLYTQSVNKTDILLPITDAFLPVHDRYLPVSATESFRDGAYLKIPTLIGVGSVMKYPEIDEWINLLSQGYFFLQRFVKKAKIPEILQLYKFNENMQELITHLIEWQYSLFIDLDGRFLIDQLKKLEYEAKIEAPLFQQVFYMSQYSGSSTYVYSMQDDDFTSDIPDESITMDLVFLLGPNIMKQISKRRFKTRDSLLSGKIQEYAINFITFGQPTVSNEKQPWRKYVLHDPYVRKFNDDAHVDKDRSQRKRILFWNDLLRQFSYGKYKFNQPSISVELSNTGPAAGIRNVILCGLLVFLLLLLIVCIVLLRRKSRMMRTSSSWTVG